MKRSKSRANTKINNELEQWLLDMRDKISGYENFTQCDMDKFKRIHGVLCKRVRMFGRC
jgi:hypothetical protein